MAAISTIKNLSIYTPGGMGAATYYAFSNARIKDISGTSDSSKDLKPLLGIKVTNYTYKDTVAHGSGQAKKVIAMLNVSATQELAHQLAAQTKEVQKLEARLTQALDEKAMLLKYLSQLEARDQAREERLTQMEGCLERGRGGAKYASFPK